MKKPKFSVIARMMKKPKTTFSRFTAAPSSAGPAGYGIAAAACQSARRVRGAAGLAVRHCIRVRMPAVGTAAPGVFPARFAPASQPGRKRRLRSCAGLPRQGTLVKVNFRATRNSIRFRAAPLDDHQTVVIGVAAKRGVSDE
jgi:hypothetical protein